MAYTFFGTQEWAGFPDPSDRSTWTAGQTVYHKSIPLVSRHMGRLSWVRRPGASSSNSVSVASSYLAGRDTGYTTLIQVPIILPGGQSWIPTFFSCFAARNYTLRVTLAYGTTDAPVRKLRIRLVVPLQICCL
jgi:hypothetical protein